MSGPQEHSEVDASETAAPPASAVTRSDSASALTEPGAAPGAAPSSSVALPPRIGAYRPLRLLGEGGMGVVYEAEQVRPRRVVALKIIRPILVSAPVLRRFEFEAEVLGRLQHPGIAQIYEAGTADTGFGPQPYFAMELVRGPRLDRYAAEKSLPLTHRIELILRLCDAVQYAHQKGVIHRDLKPGNILVDETGQPKILDFGVARATDGDVQATASVQPTSTGQVLGTLQYMAPEQARGDVDDVDTAADVYALGVIAYELFSGRPPYDLKTRSLPEAVRMICDERPSRLSLVDRTFRGDLETVIGKALEKEKSRRYATATDFAADLRRYLNHEPITARRPTLTYQLRKFAARNRAFSAAVLGTFVILFAFLVTVTIMMVRINEEQKRTLGQKQEADGQRTSAEQANAASDAVNRFLSDMLTSASPMVNRNRNVTVRELLDDASTRVSSAFKDQPVVEASLRSTIADSYLGLGMFDEATTQMREAFNLFKSAKDENDRATIEAAAVLSTSLQQMGQYDEAERLARESIERGKRVLGADHPSVIQTENDLSVLLTKTGRFAEAEPLIREVVEQHRKRGGDDNPDGLYSVINLAFVLSATGRLAESESIMRDLVPRCRRVLGEDHPDTMAATNSWAIALAKLGKLTEAEPILRELLERRKRVLGEDHPNTLDTTNWIAFVLLKQKRFADAETINRDVLERRRKTLAPDHPDIAASLYNLAETIRELPGRLPEAEQLYREALERRRKIGGNDHPLTLVVMQSLASCLERQGKSAEAEVMYKELMAAYDGAPGVPPAQVAVGRANYGMFLFKAQRLDEAEPLLRGAAERFEALGALNTEQGRTAIAALVSLYEATNRPDLATTWSAKLESRAAATRPVAQPSTR